MNYFIIGDEDSVLGFGMVGVKGEVVETAEEAKRAFENALSSQDTGILIITENVADKIRSLVDKYIFNEQFPLIVEIPDRNGPKPGKPTLRELVNQAIGIKL